MSKIKHIIFNPGTEQADGYIVGSAEVNFEGAIVDSIVEVFHPVTEEFECVEIYAEGFVAARFRGVPYAAFLERKNI